MHNQPSWRTSSRAFRKQHAYRRKAENGTPHPIRIGVSQVELEIQSALVNKVSAENRKRTE